MDNFMSFAKKGYAAYEESQQNQGQPGQQQGQGQGQPSQQQSQPDQYQSTQYQGQDQGQGNLPVNHSQAAEIANNSAGNSGNSEMFGQAMSFLQQGNHSAPVNEEHVTNAHNQVYGDGADPSSVPASTLGSAAALQTLKSVMNSGNSGGNSGGDFQTKMIGMAMSEAAQMFDKSGNGGDKQEAVNGAAATMFKLMAQSKMSSLMGGSNSGGGGLSSMLGGGGGGNSSEMTMMMGMASKFMN